MKTAGRDGQEWDVERGLPRTEDPVGGSRDDNGGSRSAEQAAAKATEAVKEAVKATKAAEVDDVRRKLDGGGGGVSVARRAAFTAAKIIAVATALTVTCAFVWYTMGLPFLLQVVVVAFIAFVASGGYRFVYLVYRTAPRDVRALYSYLHFLYTTKKLAKNNWTVADIFKHTVVKNTPHKVIFVFEDKEWTALQIEEYSNKVANAMLENGFKKGDVVGLLMENRPEFVCIWLGMSKVGIVTALINYNLRLVSLTHSVTVAKCSCLIYGAELASDVDEIKDQLGDGVKLLKWSSSAWPANDDAYLNASLEKASPCAPNPPEKPGYNDRLLYIYTSGTTGLPKAAIITNVRYVFIAGAYSHQVGLKYTDRFYTPLPLYHTAAGIMCIGQSLLYGCTVVIRKKFSASGYFQDVSKYNCTASQYIGEMCRYILATPPKAEDTNHKLRIIFGNGLKAQIWKEFVTRFNVPRVAEFYGSTEGNANIANTDNTFGAIGFVSRLIPSIYPISIIRVDPETCEPIRNENGLCTRCNPGEPGVIVGKIIESNPSRQFLGYVNNKDSEKKVVRDVFDKGDAAFLSGDLLVCDEWGYLYFKDRTGDTFRWKGENVSTAEVEGVVSNIAGYRDCVVYGVEVPNSEGRAGMAAIVDKDGTLDVAAVSDGLRKALPSYARPLFVRKLREVELTGTYKLKKLDLQKEGFNAELIKDPMYYCDGNGVYRELTVDAYNDIVSGKIRLFPPLTGKRTEVVMADGLPELSMSIVLEVFRKQPEDERAAYAFIADFVKRLLDDERDGLVDTVAILNKTIQETLVDGLVGSGRAVQRLNESAVVIQRRWRSYRSRAALALDDATRQQTKGDNGTERFSTGLAVSPPSRHTVNASASADRARTAGNATETTSADNAATSPQRARGARRSDEVRTSASPDDRSDEAERENESDEAERENESDEAERENESDDAERENESDGAEHENSAQSDDYVSRFSFEGKRGTENDDDSDDSDDSDYSDYSDRYDHSDRSDRSDDSENLV